MRGALLAVLLTAGCAPTRVEVPPGVCPGTPSGLVGRNIGMFAVTAYHRIIVPGRPVTADRRLDRLSITVDEKGWITRADCG